MTRRRPDPELLRQVVHDPRFGALAKVELDLDALRTWDSRLSRRTRLLVPVDVQALVVTPDDGEPTVDVCGAPQDPAPFHEPAPRSPGVHLHWAVPDALLRGSGAPGGALELPALPDRWAVLRTVLPVGAERALVRGWVLDARSGGVADLAGWDGAAVPPPEGGNVLPRVDGASGGSLSWTACYAAARGRLALHDPLEDLRGVEERAPRGLFRELATYAVAGWWAAEAEDPLAPVRGLLALSRRLTALGWQLTAPGEERLRAEEDPARARLLERAGFRTPDVRPDVEVRTRGRSERWTGSGPALGAAVPVADASRVVLGPALPTFATLLHGAVHGVPVGKALPAADDRPEPEEVRVSAGLDLDDVVAAAAAEALGLPADQRREAEQLVAAFAGDLLDRLASPDGLVDLLEREHADGFWSAPGPDLPASRADRLRGDDAVPRGPAALGRKGRAAAAASGRGGTSPAAGLRASVLWPGLVAGKGTRPAAPRAADPAAAGAVSAAAREVPRAAPRRFRPAPPVLGLRGARLPARHHLDTAHEDTGMLVRHPADVVPGFEGVVAGAAVLPTLGSGALPPEVLPLVQEAVVLDPYAVRWLAEAGAPDDDALGAVRTRLAAEAVRLFGTDGRYDPSGAAVLRAGDRDGPRAARRGWDLRDAAQELVASQAAAELASWSTLSGVPPSPVALTAWRQPWAPLFLEWRVVLSGGTDLTGWELDGLDLEPTGGPGPDREVVVDGRSLLGRGAASALTAALTRYAQAREGKAGLRRRSGPDDRVRSALARLHDLLAPLDVASASLDGVRENLLGIRFVGSVQRRPRPDGSPGLPEADRDPLPLFGGALRVERLRLVDAFGRVLEVPTDALAVPTHLAVPDAPTSVRLRPRLQHGARWLLRLVDPAAGPDADPALLAEAFVDQVQPELLVNPVAGFLLPDHADEELEVFDAAGRPLGALGHDAVTGAVTWEPAPGRPVPPGAGPAAGLAPQARLVGALAEGLVRADVSVRAAGGPPPGDTPLTALLRAVDATLWTVDTLTALGTPAVASLVGRPVAVVRATLALDLPDDLEEVDVTAPGGPEARRAAFAALRAQRFPVRLGDLARTDDALLGFFVDDDHEHLHVVDRGVAAQARDTGRHRGALGLLGSPVAPGTRPLDSPYVVEQDVLHLRPGQVVRLTLLLLPGGRVHLTSGVLPRKALALADDWTSPGLQRLVPSLRVGPVLVDPSTVRLPLPRHLGSDPLILTRRTGPLTWRDDPLLAATQTAYLPPLPHEVQEGWIRLAPGSPDGGSAPEAAP